MNFAPNDMMMELFRSEVDSHAETLTRSLLQWERDPSDISVLDSMMRSAHSIKGAARIVRVNAAVDVAHVMEDCFVAAQRSELTIRPSDVDALLRSVDLLIRISEATKDADASWDQIDAEAKQSAVQLACIRQGKSIEVPAASAPSPTVVDVPVMNSPTTSEPREITLRFGAALDRDHAETMRVALFQAIETSREYVRFDLSQTKDIDPIGLAFLATAKKYIEAQASSTLIFDPVSEEIRRVLRLSGLVPS